MRIEPLGDMELIYRSSTFGEKFHLVRPFGGEEGSGYGEGEGSIKGERIKGNIRWVNHSSHRSDGSVLPHFHGLIKTDDGAIVLFTLQGRTVWVVEWGSSSSRSSSRPRTTGTGGLMIPSVFSKVLWTALDYG